MTGILSYFLVLPMYVLPVENRNLKGKEPPFTQTLDPVGIHPGAPKEIIFISHCGPQCCTLESPEKCLKIPVGQIKIRISEGGGGEGRTQVLVVFKNHQVIPLCSSGKKMQNK